MPGQLYGIVCMILGLVVLVELRNVMDRQTDRHSDDSIYCTSTASCGKMSPYRAILCEHICFCF